MNVPNANTSNMPGMDASQAAPMIGQGSIGPPPMHTFTPNPLEGQPASNTKALMVLGGAVGLGLLVVGVGLCFGGRARSSSQHAAAEMPGFSRTGEQRSGPRDPVVAAQDHDTAHPNAVARPVGEPAQHASGESAASHGE